MRQATELQSEALQRARQSASVMNYPAIFSHFTAMGIPEHDIRPRENVLTFHAWKALGRHVMKRPDHIPAGRYGCKVVTWIPVTDKDTGEVTGRRCKTAVVFHISQTVELGANAGGPSGHTWHRKGTAERAAVDRDYVRDPGEDSADRWNESHGDRWIDA